MAAVDQHPVERQRLARHRRRRLQPAGELVDHLEVLQQLARVALRREVALHHARVELLQQRAVGMPAGEAFGHARGVDARGFGEQQRLRHHRVAAADDELVDHLRDQPAADRAHVREARGDVGHQRRHARDVVGVAARHHRQRAACPTRAGRRTPARRSSRSRSCSRSRAAKRLALVDLDGREVDEELRRRDRAGDAVGAEHRLLDRIGGRQVEQHEVGIARRVRRATMPPARRPRAQHRPASCTMS